MNQKRRLGILLLAGLPLFAIESVHARGEENGKEKSTPLLKELAQDSWEKKRPADSFITLQAEQTLEQCAKEVYGNSAYSRLLIDYNQMKDKSPIPVGTEIQVPSFRVFLQKAGLFSILAPEMEKLMKSQALYAKEEAILARLHQSIEQKGQVPLADSMAKHLRQAAMLAGQVSQGIQKKSSQFKNLPQKTLGQLKQLEAELNKLADGYYDAYGADRNLIHQRFAWVMGYLRVWWQEEKGIEIQPVQEKISPVSEKALQSDTSRDPKKEPLQKDAPIPKKVAPPIVLTGTIAKLSFGKKSIVISREDVEKLQKALLHSVQNSSLSDKEDLISELQKASVGIDKDGVVHMGAWVLGIQEERPILTYRSVARLGIYQYYMAQVEKKTNSWQVFSIQLKDTKKQPEQ